MSGRLYGTNTHHDVTDLVNHEIQNFLTCASDDTFLEVIVF